MLNPDFLANHFGPDDSRRPDQTQTLYGPDLFASTKMSDQPKEQIQYFTGIVKQVMCKVVFQRAPDRGFVASYCLKYFPEEPNFKIFFLIFYQVQDGGFITVRGQPRNGPPPERTIALSEIDAPKMARRPTPTNKYPNPATDEPLAWESREFLRKLLVGKTVLCTVSHKTDTGREYGWVGLGSNNPEEAESVAKRLIAEGLAKVRDNCRGNTCKGHRSFIGELPY